MNNRLLKIVLVLNTFCFLTINVYAQIQPTIDDQVNELASMLNQHRRNPDSLSIYANKLLILAKEHNYELGLYRAYLALGQAAVRKGEPKISNEFYQKALKLSHLAENNEDPVGIMNNLGLNHRRLRRNDSAMYYFKKVNKRYGDLGLNAPASAAKKNIGIAFLQYQELDSAEYYFAKALKGFYDLGNDRSMAQTLSLLAEVKYQKEEYSSALAFADSSQIVSEIINFQPNFGRNYSLLSRVHEKLGNAEKADEFSKLEEEHRLKDPRNLQASRDLNEKAKIENASRNIEHINNLKETKIFYKTNFFIASILILVLAIFLYLLFKNNVRIKRDVVNLQKKIDALRNTSNVNDLLSNNSIHLKNGVVINCGDILYIKSDGHYVEYYLNNKSKPEIDRSTMSDTIKELPNTSFVRIHKSYIVNVHRIKIINSTKIMLDSGVWINLSRTYKPLLHEILNKT